MRVFFLLTLVVELKAGDEHNSNENLILFVLLTTRAVLARRDEVVAAEVSWGNLVAVARSIFVFGECCDRERERETESEREREGK